MSCFIAEKSDVKADAEICGTAPDEPAAVDVGDELGVVVQPPSVVTVRAAMKAVPTRRAETFMCFNFIFRGLVALDAI
ncbi:MAG TPA: hypothetical protein VJQ61_12310 [Sinomonas sp.]|nr:hypothetical protein [Sinomonas sp.]